MVHNKGYVVLTLICVMLLQMPMQGCIFGNNHENPLPKTYPYSLEIQYQITTNETGELDVLLPAFWEKEKRYVSFMSDLNITNGSGNHFLEDVPAKGGLAVHFKGKTDAGKKTISLHSKRDTTGKDIGESEFYLNFSWGMVNASEPLRPTELWVSARKAGSVTNDTLSVEISIVFDGTSEYCSRHAEFSGFEFINGTWGTVKGSDHAACA